MCVHRHNMLCTYIHTQHAMYIHIQHAIYIYTVYSTNISTKHTHELTCVGVCLLTGVEVLEVACLGFHTQTIIPTTCLKHG